MVTVVKWLTIAGLIGLALYHSAAIGKLLDALVQIVTRMAGVAHA